MPNGINQLKELSVEERNLIAIGGDPIVLVGRRLEDRANRQTLRLGQGLAVPTKHERRMWKHQVRENKLRPLVQHGRLYRGDRAKRYS